MNKTYIATLGAALIALGASGMAWSEDDDDDRDRGGQAKTEHAAGHGGLTAVANQRYLTECGSCHFAYLPKLLPAPAWNRVMSTLDKHFGDDATLEPAVKDELLAYLDANAAKSGGFAAAKVTGDGPPRITDTAYFKRKHHELSAREVKDNPQVKSFSQCQACHPGADKGDFDEDRVNIPGIGAFKD